MTLESALLRGDCTTHAQFVTLQDCIIAKDAGLLKVKQTCLRCDIVDRANQHCR